jgi:exodeoxyribonuclease VII small subunit
MADKTFTESLKDLQNAASEIGRQATTLEDSLRLFDQGMKEAEYCRKILDSAEQKIQLYENGEIKDFKGVGNKLGDFVTRIGDSQTDNVAYSGMVVEFATRGCENKNADIKPITIKVTFPASYGEETLRGKEAYFDVYIESASPYSCPVFDDKFVTDKLKVTAEELASYNGETLADKYREKLREEYRTEIEESNNDLLTQAVWSHIFSNVEIKKLPRATVKSYYNSYAADINNYYTNYTQQYENVDSFAVDYINNVYGAGLSAGADWKDYMTKLAEGDVAQKIIFYYIIREENLIPSDAEYQELYDERYNEIFDYYKELHASELAELEGEEYEKELESIKKEMESIYDESYFREQIYYQYGSQKLLGLANVVK